MNSTERREARYQRRKAEREARKIAYLSRYDCFDNIASCEALAQAAKKSSKTVRWKSSVQRYFMNLLRNTVSIKKKLETDMDVTMGFICFTISDRGKSRHIRSVHFKERVVQRSLCDNALVPMLSNSLIYDNGASLKDKGIHFSLRRLRTHLSRFYRANGFSNEGYVLSIDFAGYFDNIQHEPLYALLRRHFKDERIIKLCEIFIRSFGNKSLGIGSQVSQILAVAYPNRIDHFIKQELGIKYYARYMDDSYLIHHDKKYLQHCLSVLAEQYQSLGIKLNMKKTQIIKLSRGFTFLKARCYLSGKGAVIMKPCKKSVTQMRRKLKKFRKMVNDCAIRPEDVLCSYNSWRGYAAGFNGYHAVRRLDALYNSLF